MTQEPSKRQTSIVRSFGKGLVGLFRTTQKSLTSIAQTRAGALEAPLAVLCLMGIFSQLGLGVMSLIAVPINLGAAVYAKIKSGPLSKKINSEKTRQKICAYGRQSVLFTTATYAMLACGFVSMRSLPNHLSNLRDYTARNALVSETGRAESTKFYRDYLTGWGRNTSTTAQAEVLFRGSDFALVNINGTPTVYTLSPKKAAEYKCDLPLTPEQTGQLMTYSAKRTLAL